MNNTLGNAGTFLVLYLIVGLAIALPQIQHGVEERKYRSFFSLIGAFFFMWLAWPAWIAWELINVGRGE